MNVLITGASGFVGSAVVARLRTDGRFHVRAATRRPSTTVSGAHEVALIPDLSGNATWRDAVRGVDAVVHLAARVHDPAGTSAQSRAAYAEQNVAATAELARQAVAAGVRRFVFASTAKVHGDGAASALRVGTKRVRGVPYRETDAAQPSGVYASSKYEAEVVLRGIASHGGMELVIVRPPLVYGPGVRANFRALMRLVKLGVPLPLGGVDNRRSFVALDNLVDFLCVSLAHRAAANEAFLVSDGEDLSTPDLIRRLARAMHRPARLVAIPAVLLVGGATLLCRRNAAQRLIGSFQVDISKARALLGWAPLIGVDEGLRRCVAGT